MQTILLIIYIAAGYWAVNQTFYYNKIVIYRFGETFPIKLLLGFLVGWLLIPVAILLTLIRKQ